MNRHARRAERKRASQTATEEIFRGPLTDIPDPTRAVMTGILEVLVQHLPGYHVTLFLAEKAPAEGQALPRFNYISNANRADMVAVLRAFVAKETDPRLGHMNDAPPSASAN